MSKGRYRLMWTILADLLSLSLSGVYGALAIPWIGSWMWHPAKDAAIWLYDHFFLLVPLPVSFRATYLHNTTLAWLTFALLFRLYYLLRWLWQRSRSRDLAIPHGGAPGEPYYEAVRRCFTCYREAFVRWEPKIALRLPTWRYYKRLTTDQPDVFWRGRTLVVEKSLLEPDRRPELGPILARELMYYNSEDVAFQDILAYYSHASGWQFWWNVLGLYISLPIILVSDLAWSRYWEKRVKVADEFAFAVGQGVPLYFQIEAKLQQEEALKQSRLELARELAPLEARWKVYQDRAASQNWTLLPGEDLDARQFSSADASTRYTYFVRKWDELKQQIAEVRQRDAALEQEEAKLHEVRPMLEERRGLLAARLLTEQAWLKQQGITSSPLVAQLPGAQEPSRLAGGTGETTRM